MAFIPYLAAAVAAGGALKQSHDAASQQEYNSGVMRNEATISLGQGAQAEAQSRRNSREAFGRQAAAFGAAGTGYGGSSARAMGQSLINQELDALNTRYKGTLTAYGYNTQAQIDAETAKSDRFAGYINAGTAAMKGLAGAYGPGG
jgi:hypothetical protein